jgi:hypothetical protein
MKTLFEDLKNITSEEDVKALYIKHLGLKNVVRNLVDIQSDKIWFEAKAKPTSIYQMFTQLIYYVRVAKLKGEAIPPFLCVIDNEKASLMETKNLEELFNDKSIEWEKAKSGSQVSLKMVDAVSKYIGVYTVSYNLEHYEDEFKRAIFLAIKSGVIARANINPNNLKQVFDKWVDYIGKEIINASESDYASFFYADIMSDGKNATIDDLSAQIILKNNKTAFALHNKIYDLASSEGYIKFWQIYNRPPAKEDSNYLLERRDSLILTLERKFSGAFYTPLKIVDKAYDYLNNTLGKNWQKEYIVWDMCCGVGNLEVKHSNHRNIFMSTLDNEDVNIMKSNKVCVASQKFQYDYLNDDITESGEIDYSLTNKVPKELHKAIVEGKKILVLINPPYAEATNSDNTAGINVGNKIGVAKTKFAQYAMSNYGKATNELFTQFVARILKEIPNCTLAIFAKLKYVNAPNFEDFREHFKAKYKGGFIVHSKAFDGLKGNFPIGFLIWDLAKKQKLTSITTDVVNKMGLNMGSKSFYNLPIDTYLNKWISRPRANKQEVVPLSNAFSVYTAKARVNTWSDDAIAYMCTGVNDLQNTKLVFLLSSVAGRGNGIYINKDNILKASAWFTICKIITPTWVNDRDQFLQPNKELSKEFLLDCLVYMLFHNSNLTASVDNLAYNGKNYNLVNHFITFTEVEVGANGRFESPFMSDFIAKQSKALSREALNVMDAGKKLYQLYYQTNFNHKIREEFKLNKVDVGFYQIRKALNDFYNGAEKEQHYKELVNALKIHYTTLVEKLHPQVFDLGFLRD